MPISTLRKEAVNEIKRHADDYIPFLSDPATADILFGEAFEKYLVDMAETKAWGGQVEIKAISKALNRPIEVIQAEGPELVIGEGEGNKVVITYHRHMYGLGEHYNSTIKL